ncbi:MAG TPA: acyltransferase, partial [Steroidobacteraceae bacterium]|nr:acyltransferase [Steroidobacteraceae bacterium]
MDARNIKPASIAVSRHIPSLDGIRGLSFLMVFATHAGLQAVVLGDFGVTVFFYLSGFLITTLLRFEFEKNGSINVRHFWLRRALRILPPFYLAVAGATLITLILYPANTMHGSSMAAEVFFYANYWGIYGENREAPGTGVVWSLAVEEHFYLLFPLLYIYMQKWRMSRLGQARLLWSICALILVWRCVLVLLMHASSVRIYLATDTRVDSILFGCALAVWNNPVLDAARLPPNIWKFVLFPGALVVLVLCLAYRGTMFDEIWGFSIEGAALTLVFIAAVRFYDWPLIRVLNSRPLAYLGLLSYSLYLIHDVLLRAA